MNNPYSSEITHLLVIQHHKTMKVSTITTIWDMVPDEQKRSREVVRPAIACVTMDIRKL